MKRLLFVITEDWYFVSHRLHLAKSAIDSGYQVGFVGNVGGHRQLIEDNGIEVIDWKINRGSVNVFTEIQSAFNLIKLISKFNPDVLHAVATKPVLYSAIACQILGIKSRVFALAGLGYIFSSEKGLAKLLRPFVIFTLRIALSGSKSCLIVQNPDDQSILLSNNVIKKNRTRLIRGAGVDTEIFSPKQTFVAVPLVILPARLLWDKGVNEFVECARILLKKKTHVRFALIGDPDQHNPESVSDKQLQQWVDEGVVEWWGHQTNMSEVYHQSTIVCFPSYREGLPKSLIEAASCCVPIVTFDVPGCREVVANSVNGFLVPLKDKDALLVAIETLLADENLRLQFGKAGRELVLKEFSQEKIARETLMVWQEVLE